MTDPCPQCAEKAWSNHGTTDVTVMDYIPHDLLEKHQKGLIKINFEEYITGFIKTAGFTCKSCGYTVMKDENGNITPYHYDDIEK